MRTEASDRKTTAIDLKSMTLSELTALTVSLDEPAFRAKQLYQWLHEKRVQSFDEMTNLPRAFRTRLAAACSCTLLSTVHLQESRLDGTRKYLFALPDGNLIESVRMRYRFGESVCISSQAGCRMGCKFCASTVGGLARNLTAGEMLEQVYAIERDLRAEEAAKPAPEAAAHRAAKAAARCADRPSSRRISHVVVMGSGEPFENYDALLRFLAMLTDERGMHLSQRNVTVSTCGIVPAIRRFADEGLSVNLAISLHAAVQAKREALMPVAKSHPLPRLMEACAYCFSRTGRQLTFEYALIAGVNDGADDAKALAALLKGMNCVVNLIPLNPTARGLSAPSRTHVLDFKKMLEKMKINVTIRREMGRDIDGACGQLRHRHVEEADGGRIDACYLY